jgi:hypothetical protein
LAHGIPSVPHLAGLAVEASRQAGIDDPRVVIEDSKVEIALHDSGDVALDMLEGLWPMGVNPQAVLMVIDGLAGIPHRRAPVIDPDVRATTVVLINSGRESPLSGTLTLAGGAARLRQLLVLGDEQLEEARTGANGLALTVDLEPGDMVSLHWDWVCDRLSPAACEWLRYCTRRNLEAVNSLTEPGPAVSCGA